MPKGTRVNWTDEETDKFIDLVYKMKAKGKDISFRKIKEQMQSYGFRIRTQQSLKNHYDFWGRKIRMLQQILGTTGVGYDPQTQLPVVDDERWAEIVQNYPAAEGLRTKPVRNADKLRYIFLDRHATGSMSFSPGMSSVPRVMSKMKSVQIDTKEGTGDSDDADEGPGLAREPGEESHSPPRTSRKRKSDGVSNGSNKRTQKETTAELMRLMLAKYTREVEQKSEPSIYDKVAARLEELPNVTQRGPAFIFQVLDTIKKNEEMDFFLSLKTEDIAWCYIVNRISFCLEGKEVPTEGSTQDPPYITLWEKTKRHKDGTWDPDAGAKYEELKELHRRQIELHGTDNLHVQEAYISVLKRKSGYCRGLGSGPLPPKKGREALSEAQAELTVQIQEMRQKEAALQGEIGELKSANAALKEQMEQMKAEALERENKQKQEAIEREMKLREEFRTMFHAKFG